ncbi:MAG TPA: molybdopterin-binding protein [Candidatus Limnocylindrales bacterium]
MTRPVRTAHLLAVGSELTTGETRDTNGGELAASLASLGVEVQRISALPDRLDLVVAAFRDAFEAVDLVVTTGGLGPTPDDLTREAVAEAVGETPAIDPALERWLRGLFERRGMALAAVNLKQAWLIPSATALPNANGTAPGWWVDRPDGRIAVLLPGPPREMRPMWHDQVLTRLAQREAGDGRVVRVLRTYGIGESMVVDRLGEPLFRASNPVVATYARADWLDIRISAVDEPAAERHAGRTAAELVAEAERTVREGLPGHVWATGETTWGELVAAALDREGLTLAIDEDGTRGALAALLSDVPALVRATTGGSAGLSLLPEPPELASRAVAAARTAGASIGLAVASREDGGHTPVRASIALPAADGRSVEPLDLRLFQGGAHGRLRAAVAAAAHLVEALGGPR